MSGLELRPSGYCGAICYVLSRPDGLRRDSDWDVLPLKRKIQLDATLVSAPLRLFEGLWARPQRHGIKA
ncbi:hypothetical protein P7K49_030621 [Saguinus oedipus]|uniref:3'-5' exonuclease domain-containing protein n=1 Tax=Saguinus oedipus TaxID=9490 RepID=A0ABQ9U2N6_SAGOE|nr:hypothetical protein P7K49_030621 [Saguinus oedipus]